MIDVEPSVIPSLFYFIYVISRGLHETDGVYDSLTVYVECRELVCWDSRDISDIHLISAFIIYYKSYHKSLIIPFHSTYQYSQ